MTEHKQPLTIVIMAGGTGGHVFPALAVAEKLGKENINLHWLGTAKGIEARLIPAANIPLHFLTIEGVRGKGWMTKIKAPFLLLGAVWQARKILKKLHADAVLGMGGFASGPGGVAAWLLNKPVIIHEQNAVAGTTNRWLAKVADVVLEAFPGSLKNAIHVGNPVRDSIAQVNSLELSADRPLHLLILGGSLGAQALNQLLPEAIALLPENKRPDIKHQAGVKNLEATTKVYNDSKVNAEVMAFVDDMAAVYQWADVVICRAGALTISELTLAGRGAMLIPYPYAIDDHQTANGAWLVNNDAAIICQQKDLTAQSVADFISSVGSNRPRLVAMGNNARKLAQPEAAEKVASYCQQAAIGRFGEVANG